MAFEDRYRGKEKIVSQRLSAYLPWLKQRILTPDTSKCLDLGCGRGEWLTLLADSGFAVTGIDLNPLAVQKCRQQGSDAECQDAISYLESLETESLDLVTAFHLLEHLTVADLYTFIIEVFRVVKTGGLIIFETPNPANILVSSYDFFRDPSHINPVHPETLDFILKSLGCHSSEIMGLFHPETNSESEISILEDTTQHPLNCLDDYISASRDYCLRAVK